MRRMRQPTLPRAIPLLLLFLLPACEGPVTGPDPVQEHLDSPLTPMSVVTETSRVASDRALHIGPIVQVTNDPAEQMNPQIWGDVIVWEDFRHGNWDIYAYDVRAGVELPVTTHPADQKDPAVWGDLIVWQDYRNENWDIYMYDLETDISEAHDVAHDNPEVVARIEEFLATARTESSLWPLEETSP